MELPVVHLAAIVLRVLLIVEDELSEVRILSADESELLQLFKYHDLGLLLFLSLLLIFLLVGLNSRQLQFSAELREILLDYRRLLVDLGSQIAELAILDRLERTVEVAVREISSTHQIGLIKWLLSSQGQLGFVRIPCHQLPDPSE